MTPIDAAIARLSEGRQTPPVVAMRLWLRAVEHDNAERTHESYLAEQRAFRAYTDARATADLAAMNDRSAT